MEEIPLLLDGVAEVAELRFYSEDWIGPGAPSPWRQVRLMRDNPEARRRLRESVREFRPDLLLFHNVIPVASFGLYDEARAIGLPVVQYIHNFRPFSPGGTLWVGNRVNPAALAGNPWPEIFAGGWQGSRVKTAVLAWQMWRARTAGLSGDIDKWIAPSNFMREKFVEAGIPESKIEVVRHCWRASPTTPRCEEDRHYLYLGRLVPEKGVREIVNAWHVIEARMGGRCPDLVIAGSGSDEEILRGLATGSGRVRFAGFVDGAEKDRLIRQSRGLLVPSAWWEPLGLTAYEAFAAGRPVIATRAGALQETVVDGVTGWTHEAGNISALADAIVAAEAAGTEERARRGLAGREWLQVHADPEEWRQRFLSVCGAVAATPSGVSVAAMPPRDSAAPAAPGEEQPATRNLLTAARTPQPVLSLHVYFGDQNPGLGRSLGISRMSEAVLGALSVREDVGLRLLVSKSSQQGPMRAEARITMPWSTRNRLARLLSDHCHPWFIRRRVPRSLWYYPKGFLPLVTSRCRPAVVTVHDTIIDHCRQTYPSWRRSFEYSYWAWMLTHALRSADRIMTVSKSSKAHIQQFMRSRGIPEKDITVTYEPCLYESIPQPEHPDKQDYVLHLASREPHKRTAHLVRWWLESSPASRPTLHIVGNMPADVASFASASPYIVAKDFLDDAQLRKEIMSARALILPSEIEGFGLPALEAYYLGTPVCYVIGTSVDEILEPATRAGGFELKDATSLFKALDEVLGMTPREIRRCGLLLRETYAVERVIASMMSVFREVVEEG